MFYTYIIQSQKTTGLYIGQTNNLEDRINRHNSNYNKYTKNKGPWELQFAAEANTRSEAVGLERKLKSFKNKERILQWISKNNEINIVG